MLFKSIESNSFYKGLLLATDETTCYVMCCKQRNYKTMQYNRSLSYPLYVLSAKSSFKIIKLFPALITFCFFPPLDIPSPAKHPQHARASLACHKLVALIFAVETRLPITAYTRRNKLTFKFKLQTTANEYAAERRISRRLDQEKYTLIRHIDQLFSFQCVYMERFLICALKFVGTSFTDKRKVHISANVRKTT